MARVLLKRDKDRPKTRKEAPPKSQKGQEDIPMNAPEPKAKPVRTSTYKDANLMHDLVTGRSCTGVLHFINQTCHMEGLVGPEQHRSGCSALGQ